MVTPESPEMSKMMMTPDVEVVQRLVSQLTIDDSEALKLSELVGFELQRGLEAHKNNPTYWDPNVSDFMMIDTYVQRLPGKETGIFYSMDMGGTNLRVTKASLNEGRFACKNHDKVSLDDLPKTNGLPNGVLDARATASELFGALADFIYGFMGSDEDAREIYRRTGRAVPIGFTCSFGVNQTAINSGIISDWAKDIQTGNDTNDPVVGRDICELLNNALEKRHSELQKVDSCTPPIIVNCTMNDTTATLIAASIVKHHSAPVGAVGVIIGTGFNVCYYEPTAADYGYNGVVINVEAGGFRHARMTDLDIELDASSSNRGRQPCEKKISGLYLGQLFGIALSKVFPDGRIAKDVDRYPNLINSILASSIFNLDPNQSDFYDKMRELLPSHWVFDDAAYVAIYILCEAIMMRGARLSAIVVASICRKTGLESMTVGLDGSVILFNKRYQAVFNEILNKHGPSLNIVPASGGSSSGACLLSAVTEAVNYPDKGLDNASVATKVTAESTVRI